MKWNWVEDFAAFFVILRVFYCFKIKRVLKYFNVYVYCDIGKKWDKDIGIIEKGNRKWYLELNLF